MIVVIQTELNGLKPSHFCSQITQISVSINPSIRPTWREAWSRKEDAMRTRMPCSTEALDMHARSLAPLSLGDKVFLQNQRGSHPKK